MVDVTAVGAEADASGWFGSAEACGGSGLPGVMIVVGICSLGMGGLWFVFSWFSRRFLSGIGFTVSGAWLDPTMTGVWTAFAA